MYKKLENAMKKLFKADKIRFNHIWNKLFRPRFVMPYVQTCFDERNLPHSKTSFGQKVIEEITLECKRLVKNSISIFPHLYVFRVYKIIDRREGISGDNQYILSMEEYIGESKIMPYRDETILLSLNEIGNLTNTLLLELKRDFSEPLYIVWLGNDPRAVGDYYSEVSETIAFIGFEDEAIDFYKSRKRGTSPNRGNYVSYPQKLKNKTLKVGDKNIIQPARQRPTTQYDREVESWEIEHGY
jgi:hypothetical protein